MLKLLGEAEQKSRPQKIAEARAELAPKLNNL